MIELEIKNNEGIFVPFNQVDFKIVDSILYSEDSYAEYENILFADKKFLSELKYIELRIKSDNTFDYAFVEMCEGLEPTAMNLLKSKHSKIGNIGFRTAENDFYFITKNEISNSKIKITKENDECLLYLFVIKNNITQDINVVKEIISRINVTIL